jgi:hypothetical protein
VLQRLGRLNHTAQRGWYTRTGRARGRTTGFAAT